MKEESCLVLRKDVEPFTKPLEERIKELEKRIGIIQRNRDSIYNQKISNYARIKEIEDALREYGIHKNNCAYRLGLRGSTIEQCDCGFSKALK